MASRFNFGLNGLAGGLQSLGSNGSGSGSGSGSGESGGPGEMPFFDHLEELRWRIVWSLVAFAIMGGIGIWISFRFDLIALLIDPSRPYLDCSKLPAAIKAASAASTASPVAPCDGRLSITSLTDPMFIQIKLGLLLGFLMSFPVIAYQAWAFLSPALHQKEKRILIPALYAGLVLFVAGALLAYFYILPSTARIMLGFMTPDMRQNIGLGDYIDLVAKLMVALGLVFELPVVMLILGSLGLVTSKFLKKNRRFAIAIMAIAASILTPGDAITATMYMMLPLYMLYEVSIWLVMIVEKRRAKHLAAMHEEEAAEEAAEAAAEAVASEAREESVSTDVEQW